jgi:ribokinase
MDADWQPVLPIVDAFLPSRTEATELLGRWPGAAQAVRELAELGAPTAVIKLGTEGSVGLRGEELATLPAATTDPVDPTGCGDAFCGGFLVGLTETGDLRRAMAYGTVSAGLVADDHGAAHALDVSRDEVLRRLANVG